MTSKTLDPGLDPGRPDADSSGTAGLSTQPEDVEAAPATPGRGLRQVLVAVRQAWRQLTSMRTALLLLFLLALASVPGSLLPQRGVNPLQVADYYEAHPELAPVLERLWAFDVYASPWFAAVYLLLFVSLVGCLGPRIRLHARALRARPPAAPRALSRLRESSRAEVPLDVEEAAARAQAVLRRGRWRVVRREEPGGAVALSAEKGYLRETGNLVFHVSLVVLLVGVALGAVLGYRGTVLVVEGDGFANAGASYDDLTPGRMFDGSRMEPFALTLADFHVAFAEDGQPLEFAADVLFSPTLEAEPRAERLRVNEPLTAGSARVFLLGHGYAPELTIRDSAGAVVFEGPTPCLPQDLAFASTCVVKVPDAAGPADAEFGTQLGFRATFAPTAEVREVMGRRVMTSGHPELRAPALDLVAFRGDLGIDAGVPQNVYQLETVGMNEIGSAFLAPGDTYDLPGGGSVTFTGIKQWANLQVTSDPGKLLVLGAGVAAIAGLMLSLRVRRRRVWVRVRPGVPGEAEVAGGKAQAPAPTLVEVGGLSRSDAEGFSAEFDGLVAALPGGGAARRRSRAAGEQE